MPERGHIENSFQAGGPPGVYVLMRARRAGENINIGDDITVTVPGVNCTLAQRQSRSAIVALILTALNCRAMSAGAQETASSTATLNQIVVTAERITSDDAVSQEVAAALRSDPYVFDEHITVTTKAGVVTLHGIALDYWDVQMMKRISQKVAGVKRVVNDIDVRVGGD